MDKEGLATDLGVEDFAVDLRIAPEAQGLNSSYFPQRPKTQGHLNAFALLHPKVLQCETRDSFEILKRKGHSPGLCTKQTSPRGRRSFCLESCG